MCGPIKLAAGGTVIKKDQAQLRWGSGINFSVCPQYQVGTSHRAKAESLSDISAARPEVGPSGSPFLPAQDGVQAQAGFLELGPPPEHPLPTRTQNHPPVSGSQLE